MRRIATESGPEAVAFAVTTSSGTAISDAQPWIDRLINAFGSPNNCNAWEICAWHRQTGIGTPDYAKAGCILLWGHNPSTSLLAAAFGSGAALASSFDAGDQFGLTPTTCRGEPALIKRNRKFVDSNF
jgi:hypothetical protein